MSTDQPRPTGMTTEPGDAPAADPEPVPEPPPARPGTLAELLGTLDAGFAANDERRASRDAARRLSRDTDAPS